MGLNEESSAPPALRAGQWEKERIVVPEEESSAPPALRAGQWGKERIVVPEEDTSGF
jgi:hypothetical protein